ncbi:flagellar protein FlaG protein [Alishewanella aestuarii B11]|uniref:Flagellar protein FlaG protein n=1 Tax=Alishewanella aestuarii B11 TaxID=1197174 RepID=J1Y8N1_9ALTE|nr:flagellar protein FlaG [Alishewanella aestuarii]EJI84105.1 flagellar protein FlaG protein [Alishewanella aestuarii B11]
MSSINANSASVFSYTATADKIAKAVAAEPNVVNETSPGALAVAGVQPISKAELQQAVDVVNQAVALEQRSLSFSIDDVSGRSVIKVVDFETEELIKQIPSEELLKVAQDIKRLQEEMGQSIGLLIDKTV